MNPIPPTGRNGPTADRLREIGVRDTARALSMLSDLLHRLPREHAGWDRICRAAAPANCNGLLGCPLLTSTPSREVARTMKQAKDPHFGWCHLVEEAVPEHENLAESRIIDLGDNATALRQRHQS